MASKWLIGVTMLFLIGTVVCNVIEFQAPIGSPGTEGSAGWYVWTALNSWELVKISDMSSWWNIMVGLENIMVALWHMLLWQYNFLEGDWWLIRWILLFPISVGLVFSLLITLLPWGKSSS